MKSVSTLVAAFHNALTSQEINVDEIESEFIKLRKSLYDRYFIMTNKSNFSVINLIFNLVLPVRLYIIFFVN